MPIKLLDASEKALEKNCQGSTAANTKIVGTLVATADRENAGAMFAWRKTTDEGFEQTIALNHLAPFLLTNLLRDRLAGGRVVTTSSDAHSSGALDLDDLQSEQSYAAMRVYGTSSPGSLTHPAAWYRSTP